MSIPLTNRALDPRADLLSDLPSSRDARIARLRDIVQFTRSQAQRSEAMRQLEALGVVPTINGEGGACGSR